MNVQDIIQKLDEYSGEDDYLSKDELSFITTWLVENLDANPETFIRLIDGLQWLGFHTPDVSQALYPVIITCFKSTKNVDIASKFLQMLSDIAYYSDALSNNDIEWIIKESRDFNNESRLYKICKSDLLAKVLGIMDYKDIWPSIYEWIARILSSQDEEYIDLLAFCITNNEVKLPKHLKQWFRDYIQSHPKQKQRMRFVTY